MLSSFSKAVREGFGRLTGCARKDKKITDDGESYTKVPIYTGPIAYTEPTLYTGPKKAVPRLGYRTTYEILRELNKEKTVDYKTDCYDNKLADETAKAKVLLQKLREERLQPKSFIDILEGR